VPYTNVRQYFSRPSMNYNISVRAYDPMMMELAISEAEGLFRIIRRLDPGDESDFNITSSDQLSQMLMENLKFVRFTAVAIGIITLLGAGIGLMNIMLVSVTERTREIGTRKALGAKSKMIRRQFLYEAIVIGQIGGVVGIILGILIGNGVSLAIGTSFIVPWSWIIMGVLVCFVVGLLSGVIPARKASGLDPITALRHE
jgi:putative ABC transport system permease protein